MDEQTKISVRIGQATPAPLKRFYRVDEVAVYFAISARTVYRLLDMGDLQATRIRGCLRVSSDELKRFEALLEREDDIH
jgi:excisionase family DNA binding protein